MQESIGLSPTLRVQELRGYYMSVCPTCGLPSEICVCEEIAVSETTLKINTERRSFGKYVTIVHGVKDAKIDVKKLAKMLKSKCATGGTVKGNNIELQGNQIKKVQKILQQKGYSVNNQSKD
jgi:translation initiation factor 1